MDNNTCKPLPCTLQDMGTWISCREMEWPAGRLFKESRLKQKVLTQQGRRGVSESRWCHGQQLSLTTNP